MNTLPTFTSLPPYTPAHISFFTLLMKHDKPALCKAADGCMGPSSFEASGRSHAASGRRSSMASSCLSKSQARNISSAVGERDMAKVSWGWQRQQSTGQLMYCLVLRSNLSQPRCACKVGCSIYLYAFPFPLSYTCVVL